MSIIERISGLLLQSDSDEDDKFSNKQKWINSDALDTKLIEYIKPHCAYYHSPLRHLFLFEIKELEPVSYFNFILARDGLLSTLKFFHKFRRPESIKTIFLLNKRFAPIVPAEWMPQVAWYRTCESTGRSSVETNPRSIILTAILDPYQCNLNYLEERVSELLEHFGDSLASIPIICSLYNSVPLGEEKIDEDPGYYFDFVKKLHTLLGDNIRYQSWRDLSESNLSGTLFLDLNQNDFLYSDSYAIYHLFSSGALPFDLPLYASDGEGLRVDMSPWHYLELTEGRSEEVEIFSHNLWQEIDRLDEWVLEGKDLLKRHSIYYDEVNLCTPAFKSFALDLSRRLVNRVSCKGLKTHIKATVLAK